MQNIHLDKVVCVYTGTAAGDHSTRFCEITSASRIVTKCFADRIAARLSCLFGIDVTWPYIIIIIAVEAITKLRLISSVSSARYNNEYSKLI